MLALFCGRLHPPYQKASYKFAENLGGVRRIIVGRFVIYPVSTSLDTPRVHSILNIMYLH